jgi:plasmid stabilization system protein ParE
MPFEVVTSRLAAADLAAVVAHLVEIDPELALSVRRDIIGHIEDFRDNPFVGEIIKRTEAGVLPESLCGSYRVFFTVNEVTSLVIVLRIRHVKRRNLKSLE